MQRFKQHITELSNPADIAAYRKSVAGVTDVDSRDQSWNDTLTGHMKKFGFKKLGSGKYGSVFGNAKYPYVIKVFMKDAAYLRWLKFCMSNKNNPYIPAVRGKVIKITPTIYAVRLEKLTSGSFTGPFYDEYRKWVADNSFKSSNKDIQDILDYFGKGDNKKLLDIHGDNVMKRGSQLVVIDPFYNWFGKYDSGKFTIDPNEVDDTLF